MCYHYFFTLLGTLGICNGARIFNWLFNSQLVDFSYQVNFLCQIESQIEIQRQNDTGTLFCFNEKHLEFLKECKNTDSV